MGYVCTVAPVLLPLGASVGANIVLVMAAILSGCAFGNHACFYCDTTVLASNGAGIDNLSTQELSAAVCLSEPVFL